MTGIEGKKKEQRDQIFRLCAKLEGKLLAKLLDNTIDESCNEEDIKEWFLYYAKQYAYPTTKEETV